MKTYFPITLVQWCFRNGIQQQSRQEKVPNDIFNLNERIKLTKIIEDVRKIFSVGIMKGICITDQKITLTMVEGDATKQYFQVCSYSVKFEENE